MRLCPKNREASSFASVQGCNTILDITLKFKVEIFFANIGTSGSGDLFHFFLSQSIFSTGHPGNA